MSRTVAQPRAPFGTPGGSQGSARRGSDGARGTHGTHGTGRADGAMTPWARWYETVLDWASTDGPPVGLLTGSRFDVLEAPLEAGKAALRRLDALGCPTGPVAVADGRLGLLVATGSADELPGLLDWLEWGGITLGLTARGAGGRMTAPPPPGTVVPMPPAGGGGTGSREAAHWLRPPVPGREVEPTLPALSPFGRGPGANQGHGPDLVRLLDTVATECHRARLLRTNARAPRSAHTHEYPACEYSAD
ncbi:SCO3374 family protein [Streptomyces sp. NPDC057638]|uniref:SCO3374 family protein n=1 Tax=Streptomyces sp. NPDC057638 TaxID=3346190 RepID=UPI0036C17F15